MLTIWGRNNSTNVKKVLWCAEELGLTYEHRLAGGAFGIVNDPDYRRLNPNGLVPTIDDDGFALWESNTIVRYLAAKHASGTLYPTDLQQRAAGERWMDWATSRLAGVFRDVFWGIVRTPEEKRDNAAIKNGIENCNTLLTIVDAALANQPYLSGSEFGVGDIPLGCFAYAWFEMPIARKDLPNLEAWYNRLKERPAYQRAVMIELT